MARPLIHFLRRIRGNDIMNKDAVKNMQRIREKWERSMGKIALFLPKEEMLHQAHNLLPDYDLDVAEVKRTDTKGVLTEAKRAVEEGVTIIITRGLQALLLKKYTAIPVIEITMTAQEMGLLVVKAKRIVNKPNPRIALVGFPNMFSDMSCFSELYDVDFRTYFVDNSDEIQGQVKKAVNDQCDLIIGGDSVLVITEQYQIQSLYLTSTEESMRQALETAKRMDYAMGVEKRSVAQLETLIDYSDNGIIQIDGHGNIVSANAMMEGLIQKTEGEIHGSHLCGIFPEIRRESLKGILEEGRDYSFQAERNQALLFAVIAPIVVDEKVEGAIVTCHRMRRPQLEKPETGTDADRKRKFAPVVAQFSDIIQESEKMQECVQMAKLFAYSEQPVVLLGEPGTERRIIAESIHNSSLRKNGPFVDIPCDGLTGQEQWNLIFGEKGAAVQVQGGTLLLQDADQLSLPNQYCLYQLIRFQVYYGAQGGSLRKLDVRVIVTVSRPLSQLVKEGKLRKDLFYLLSGLELEVPPLRERKEDLEQKLLQAFQRSCDRYSHYHILTEGTKIILNRYPWPGNLFQIDSFMDRLVLTAKKRVFDEIAIVRLLQNLYPEEAEGLEEESQPDVLYAQLLQTGKKEKQYTALVNTEEAVKIQETLRHFCGNREKTAEALGVSKVTLWRYMKKYGIEV